MAEVGLVVPVITMQVVAETERALAKKAPAALPFYRELVRTARPRIMPDPSPAEVAAHAGIIAHPPDVPIVVAAMNAKVDYLVTLNRRHFVDDPEVAVRSGLRIGTPGDALAWVRERLAGAESV
jgi:predicted nucleic acid-binding protein